MQILRKLFSRRKQQSDTPKSDRSNVETSATLPDLFKEQVDNAEKSIHLNLRLLGFLLSCGSLNEKQLAAMKKIILESGLPSKYTENMLATANKIECNLDTLLPHHLDEWRVKTGNDLSREIPIFLDIICKIDPQYGLRMSEMVAKELRRMSET
ncbi:MAG: hypothetical protein WBW16_03345 [Bacteroidota bacterium]